MLTIDTAIGFVFVSVLISLSPGPSNLYIMARSLAQGPRAGYAAALGMAVGSFIYVILTVLGIAAIFKYSPATYIGLKLCGAAYLVYLGYLYFDVSEYKESDKPEIKLISTGKILRQSLTVELTNPKTALFFLAFLPQFVDEQAGSVALQLLVLGAIYALVAFVCDVSVATAAGKLGRWLSQHPNSVIWQDRFAGVMLVGIGIFICYETVVELI